MVKSNNLKIFLDIALIIFVIYIVSELFYWFFRNKTSEKFTLINPSDTSDINIMLNTSSGDDNSMEYVKNSIKTPYSHWSDSKSPAGITIIKNNKILNSSDTLYTTVHNKITVSVQDSDGNDITANDDLILLDAGDTFTISYTYQGDTEDEDLGSRTVSVVDGSSLTTPEIFRFDLNDVDNIVILGDSDKFQLQTISIGGWNDIDTSVAWDKSVGLTKIVSSSSPVIPNPDEIPNTQDLTYTYTGYTHIEENTETGDTLVSVDSVNKTMGVEVISPINITSINPITTTTSERNWCNDKLSLDKVYITDTNNDETELYNSTDGTTSFNITDVTTISELKSLTDGEIGVDITVPSNDDKKVVNEQGTTNIKFDLDSGIITNAGDLNGLQWNVPLGKNYSSYDSSDVKDDICSLNLNILLNEASL